MLTIVRSARFRRQAHEITTSYEECVGSDIALKFVDQMEEGCLLHCRQASGMRRFLHALKAKNSENGGSRVFPFPSDLKTPIPLFLKPSMPIG